jgi:hypothetical protein
LRLKTLAFKVLAAIMMVISKSIKKKALNAHIIVGRLVAVLKQIQSVKMEYMLKFRHSQHSKK